VQSDTYRLYKQTLFCRKVFIYIFTYPDESNGLQNNVKTTPLIEIFKLKNNEKLISKYWHDIIQLKYYFCFKIFNFGAIFIFSYLVNKKKNENEKTTLISLLFTI